MLKLLLLLAGNLVSMLCIAQKNYGVNQDYYIYQNEKSVIVPLVYYQTKTNWYASIRYNYEEMQTGSFQFGKKFSKQGGLSYSITPLAGLLAGDFNGFSFGTQVEIETGKFSFYTEPEYCFQIKGCGRNFFYGWSELSFQPSKFFYTGLALQGGGSRKETVNAEPGIMIGIILKKFEIPLYLFRSSTSPNYFVMGIHWFLEKNLRNANTSPL